MSSSINFETWKVKKRAPIGVVLKMSQELEPVLTRENGDQRKTAQQPIYSNISSRPQRIDEDLPLPPPPPMAYTTQSSEDAFPDPPSAHDDYLPAPPENLLKGQNSSSKWGHYANVGTKVNANTRPSYAPAPTFNRTAVGFRPESAVSSDTTYDNSSIYEPVNPRPASQMSNRSNYSTASGMSSIYSASGYYPKGNKLQSTNLEREQPVNNAKEDEVDQLTDLLVKSMENSNDPDFFGICFKCKGKVLGEGSGCTAMSQIYHIKCFTCNMCDKELRGLPFFVVEGKPHCERDYLETLEKCCVCAKPITDRILRATGKPYHPDCFKCIVCGKCLDGIPFTVDNVNRVHCIEDFHKKFAPRCCVCALPILPEAGQQETVRVVAMDKSYHVNCYKCEDCGLILTSEGEGRGCYPLDGHILCKGCNATRVQKLTAPTLPGY
ncbi:Lipoma-preferred partner -like protein [Halotydeus destructor]|nr:Lipoma-preferred partner -like protein [Halotydeus destructor]